MKRLALLSLTLAVLATPVHAQTAAQSPTVQSPGFNGLFFDKSGPTAPPARATGMIGFVSAPFTGAGPVQAAPAAPTTRRHKPPAS